MPLMPCLIGLQAYPGVLTAASVLNCSANVVTRGLMLSVTRVLHINFCRNPNLTKLHAAVVCIQQSTKL